MAAFGGGQTYPLYVPLETLQQYKVLIYSFFDGFFFFSSTFFRWRKMSNSVDKCRTLGHPRKAEWHFTRHFAYQQENYNSVRIPSHISQLYQWYLMIIFQCTFRMLVVFELHRQKFFRPSLCQHIDIHNNPDSSIKTNNISTIVFWVCKCANTEYFEL